MSSFSIPFVSALLKIDNLNSVNFKLCTHDFGLITKGDLHSCQDTHKIFIIKDAKNQVCVLIFLFKEEGGKFVPIFMDQDKSKVKASPDYQRYQCDKIKQCEKKCTMSNHGLFSNYNLNGTTFTYFTRTLKEFKDSNLVKVPSGLEFIEDFDQSKQMLNEQLLQVIQPPTQPISLAPTLQNSLPIANNRSSTNNVSQRISNVGSNPNRPTMTSSKNFIISPSTNMNLSNRNSTIAERSSIANAESVFNIIDGKNVRIGFDFNSNLTVDQSNTNLYLMNDILNILKQQNPFMYQFIQIGIIYGFTVEIRYSSYSIMNEYGVLDKLTFVIFYPSRKSKTEIRYTPLNQYIKQNPQSTMNNLYSYLDTQRKVQQLRVPVTGGKKKSKRKTTSKKKKVSKK
jgi:hypothetical protein